MADAQMVMSWICFNLAGREHVGDPEELEQYPDLARVPDQAGSAELSRRKQRFRKEWRGTVPCGKFARMLEHARGLAIRMGRSVPDRLMATARSKIHDLDGAG